MRFVFGLLFCFCFWNGWGGEICLGFCWFLFFEWSRFISDKPYTFEELVSSVKRFKLDVKHQVEEYGFAIEQDTLNFWQSTAPETRARINPKKDDLTVKQFGNQLIEMLAGSKKVDYWWTRGNNFDPPIIWRLMRKAGKYHDFNQYVLFHRLRDIRTFIDAKLDFGQINGFIPVTDEQYWNATFKPHNSQHDVAADVMRLQTITRIENDMEQPAR